MGISNVSFGLPPVGREILNSVFLYHCTQAGLDYAIVNTEKLERFASISKEEVLMAEKLLFETTDESLAIFTDFYRDKKKESKSVLPDMTLEERLAYYILEGTKEGLLPDLELALQAYPAPLDIINGPLMNGMKEVGRLFNDNQLIVAEVLQSAEVMKASVAYLEPHMEKGEAQSSSKGKIILATVKGDVHDIGKNLVDIILSNNGYEVIDLGIKVSPAELIENIRRENPDMVGLSGLLVKSAQQMVITAHDMKQAGIDIPILVGGAALSRKFTDTKISKEYDGLVLYAKDAMNGLSLANQLQEPEEAEKLRIQQDQKQAAALNAVPYDRGSVAVAVKPKPTVSTQVPVFVPKDLKRHLLKAYSLSHIEPYINKQMLIGHHLGLKGNLQKLLAEKDEKAIKINALVDELIAEANEKSWIEPKAVYQFFPAQSDGDKVIIYAKDEKTVIETFEFPRQETEPFLCLADFLKSKESDQMDYVSFFTVTAGKGIRGIADSLKAEGRFLESHALQSLALETAEGLAELIHRQIRDRWGFPDPVEMTMKDRFAAKYQGQRFSYGYPACPDLEDQKKLFKLIQPEDIGVHLTEECMMEPEASVSAMVFAHPEARYFNVLR
ncbi:vitamin B12 dependent-methionine synthase activation domain-containing protein [Cytobacillus firmus]|uniref:vitamin B12 dependent-methionine synthase activation domain-containing protein n=1 Tax=Cytobacillus firmus TaxID=1399 RepID=UPI00351A56E4